MYVNVCVYLRRFVFTRTDVSAYVIDGKQYIHVYCKHGFELKPLEEGFFRGSSGRVVLLLRTKGKLTDPDKVKAKRWESSTMVNNENRSGPTGPLLDSIPTATRMFI